MTRILDRVWGGLYRARWPATICLAVLFVVFTVAFNRRHDRLVEVAKPQRDRLAKAATLAVDRLAKVDKPLSDEFAKVVTAQMAEPPAIPDGRGDGYTPEDVWVFGERIGPDGRKYYVDSQFALDFAFPPIYAGLFAVVLVWVWDCVKGTAPNVVWLLLAPAGALVADLAENVTLIGVMNQFDAKPAGLVQFGSRCTVTKWFLVHGSMFCIGAGAVLTARFSRSS